MTPDDPITSRVRPAAASTPEDDPTLVRLHGALRDLDEAIYGALRALDVALGRNPTSEPAKGLPLREMGRLQLHLEHAQGRKRESARPSLGEMALETQDAEETTEVA